MFSTFIYYLLCAKKVGLTTQYREKLENPNFEKLWAKYSLKNESFLNTFKHFWDLSIKEQLQRLLPEKRLVLHSEITSNEHGLILINGLPCEDLSMLFNLQEGKIIASLFNNGNLLALIQTPLLEEVLSLRIIWQAE